MDLNPGCPGRAGQYYPGPWVPDLKLHFPSVIGNKHFTAGQRYSVWSTARMKGPPEFLLLASDLKSDMCSATHLDSYPVPQGGWIKLKFETQ